MADKPVDEVGEIKGVQQLALRLNTTLEAIGKIKPQSPGATAELEKALRNLPPQEDFTSTLSELRRRGEETLDRVGHSRSRHFTAVEASFVQARQRDGRDIRQIENGWRIDSLELSVRPQRSDAKVLYNRQTVVDWSPIRIDKDLEDLVAKGNASLSSAALPIDIVREALDQAYDYLRLAAKSDLIRLREIYPEFRVALLRRELKARPERPLRNVSLPLWAFLHNLDLYRANAASLRGRRLGWTTGSQSDTQKFGVVLFGLPGEEYRVMCYAQPV